MALDKSTVKIRLENATGDAVAFGDVGSGLRVSCATTGKLKSLDSNGDGEVSLQELVDSLDAQASQKHQLFLQRCVIIGGVLLLVCSFGLSLGSSILSFMLMSQLEIHGGALTDREGQVLGSEPRHPTVNNVTMGEDASRRLESGSSIGHFDLPMYDFKQALSKYKAGSTEFVVPINDGVVTVQIKHAASTSAHGLVDSGEWWADCDDASHCSIMVQQLHSRAAFLEHDGTKKRRLLEGRRLMWASVSAAQVAANEVESRKAAAKKAFDTAIAEINEALSSGCGTGKEIGACELPVENHDVGGVDWKKNPACHTPQWCHKHCCHATKAEYDLAMNAQKR